jgi:GTP1/Obg family GTP-binding protein
MEFRVDKIVENLCAELNLIYSRLSEVNKFYIDIVNLRISLNHVNLAMEHITKAVRLLEQTNSNLGEIDIIKLLKPISDAIDKVN